MFILKRSFQNFVVHLFFLGFFFFLVLFHDSTFSFKWLKKSSHRTRIYSLKFSRIKVYLQIQLIFEHCSASTDFILITKIACINNSILFVYILNFNLTSAGSHHDNIIQNSVIAIEVPYPLSVQPHTQCSLCLKSCNHYLFIVSIDLSLPACRMIGITYHVAFLDWPLSLRNKHLSSSVFSHSMIAHFFQSLSNIPLYGGTKICLAVQLLQIHWLLPVLGDYA